MEAPGSAPAGLSNWTFNWGTGPAHTATLLSRAVDDSGNVGQPGPSVTVTVGGTVTCPCSIWPSYQVPDVTAHQEAAALELGVKFQTDTAGYYQRDPVLQERSEHRGPHRQSLDGVRHTVANGHVYIGNGERLAAGVFR